MQAHHASSIQIKQVNYSRMNKLIVALIISVLVFTGCEDMFEPATENILPKEFMYEDAMFASGLLLSAYQRLPSNGVRHSDVATDNAVHNDPTNALRQIAGGRWASDFNPISEWNNSYSAIMYLNLIINGADRIDWAMDPQARLLYSHRFKGEAKGLRALFMLNLMQHHAGIATNGQLMGVPIITEFLESDDNFNIPRATFQEVMEFIYNDLDSAIALLPLDFNMSAATDSLFITKYAPLEIPHSVHNRVFGANGHGRMNRRIAEAILSRAKLFAASPAYSRHGSETTWAEAASAAVTVLNRVGGTAGVHVSGLHQWFSHAATIDRLAAGQNPPDIIWRSALIMGRGLEEMNLPPTLAGQGRINPSRNLVDAFPMLNGRPITDPLSGFNPNAPYTGRDPRLGHFIVRNDATAGVGSPRIITSVDGTTNNALNRVPTSTRTGYYLRKLLRMDVNLNPVTNRNSIRPHIRYTEILLNYAEAANEVGGPDWIAPGATYSPRTVIRAIRARAGIPAADPHLVATTTQEAMRELIRNERRIELAFEDFRFWDLRRWEANLNEPIRGTRVRGLGTTASPFTFEVFEVETRNFEPFMIYGPIPRSEVLKYDALLQNQGW